MSPSSNTSSVIPVFNGEHYHIWAVKMRFYLRSQGLWNVVMSEADPPPLGANPTVAQMKAYEEEKLKKDKAITCLHSGLTDHIFTKIMNLETPKQVWDKLQGEFEVSERVKTVRLLTLKREFELMKMKDDESVKDYSGRLMDVVNQMRLLGEAFTDQKVVEKIMVSVPQEFEAKISAIEESCDLQTLTIVELTSKLHAQEQRVLMKGDEATEGAFQANHKGKNSGNLQGKKFFKNNKGKAEGSSRKKKFRLALIVEEPTMLRKIFGTKISSTKGQLGNCEVVQAKGKGTIAISTKRGTKIVTNVLYIPDLDQNLLSVAQMLRNGYAVSFKENFVLSLIAKIDESVVWHKRYGHFNLKSLRFMQEAGMVEDMPEISVNAQTCESCELGKQQRQPFPQNMSKRATHNLELIHSDICGPMSTASLSNNVYFALFIDDLSRMTWVYFLKTKSQVFSVFKSFKKMVETQSGQNVKVLRTDNGGEYISNNVFCQETGIVHQLTAPYSPQQDGVSERKKQNRDGDGKSKTPIEAWSGVKPSIKHLKVFGSFCYLHVSSVKRGKLDERAEKGVFVGYAAESKAIESTIIEGPLDVEATSDTLMLKMRSLSDVYERFNLVHAEPTCYTEAARFLEWIEAMKAEIDSIERNGTWKLTELPKAKNAIVAGVDYGDTFALVARHDTIRLLLALAGQMGWKVYHLDVKSAFLNGILLKEIYVQQPEGFEVIGHEYEVYKLHKALYGLKQAPRAWYSRIDSHLIQLGFRRMTGSNVKLLADFKMEMQDVFEMSGLGIMNYFLGMEIYQCSWGIFISQRKYAMDILKKFKLESCKEVATPLAQNEKISKNV
ncbi:Retrovirus-related Pol polyprotein from transposon TNT 1-94 [Vitis vinifera]|uniref:Retrovirus-related Pol polyprotein from transposon TNT 1-94 n=1 Tax=Vitis vinifera TaxID=29760 RepID=A0A438HDV1_VITVI|nr:Retrovirus-related Pol polyprotein from transposon TNT 1-94 [Vitis vinifera]